MRLAAPSLHYIAGRNTYNQIDYAQRRKPKKVGAFSKWNKHDDPVASLDYVHIHKSIIYVYVYSL